VLAFYVADWHPVCTAQLERYRDLLPELERLGAGLAAISADTVWSHGAFARAHGLPFPLLADDRPRAAMARAYGVYDAQREGAQRALFVVDPAGTVAWSAVFPEAVDPGVDGILTTLERLAGRVATPDAPPSVAPDAGGGQGTVETAPRPSRPRPVRTGRSRTATQAPPTGRGAGPPAGAA
jgi:peroxiredoxin